MHKDSEGTFELHVYDAMTYSDVKNFGLTLLRDLQNRLDPARVGKARRMNRHAAKNEEDLAFYVANELSRSRDTEKHKIIVIDNVDRFFPHVRSFALLIKAMHRGTKHSKQTNTSVVCI